MSGFQFEQGSLVLGISNTERVINSPKSRAFAVLSERFLVLPLSGDSAACTASLAHSLSPFAINRLPLCLLFTRLLPCHCHHQHVLRVLR
jgi:hypothetical protein